MNEKIDSSVQQTFQEFIYEKIVIFAVRGSLLLTTNQHGIKYVLGSWDKVSIGSLESLEFPGIHEARPGRM